MSDDSYFIRSRGKVSGPYDAVLLGRLIERGVFTRVDEVSADKGNWHQLDPAEVEDKPGVTSSSDNETPTTAPSAERFFYQQDGRAVGPIPIELLDRLVVLGQLAADTPVWKDGDTASVLAGDIVGSAGNTTPAPLNTSSRQQALSLQIGVGAGIALVAILIFAAVMIDPAKTGSTGQPTVPTDPGPAVSPPDLSLAVIAPNPPSFAAGPAILVQSATSQENSLAVGLVVIGVEVSESGRRPGVLCLGTGTCFLVSSQGFALTNKHVVEMYEKLQSDVSGREAIFRQSGKRIVPRIWLFLDSRRHDAQFAYSSPRFDLAIIKVAASPRGYYGLRRQGDVARNTKVYALGFPGLAKQSIDESEMRQEAWLRQKLSQGTLPGSAEEYFKPRDFIYSQTDGSVSRVYPDGSDSLWVEHGAVVRAGNSGGPLLDGSGLVIGINTLRVFDKEGRDAPMHLSLSISQLRDEIDRVVPDVTWR